MTVRYDNLRFSSAEGIAVVTLDRPERRNSWTVPMIHEMSDALRRCDNSDSVRVVVITGAGDTFSAGADLDDGPISSPGSDERPDEILRELVTPNDVRKPVIAAINGDAIGIGLTSSLLCDLRIVARDARLAIPMTRLGVTPEMGAHWILPRIAGHGVASDLLLTGRRIDGAEAVRLGVCNECVDRGEVLHRAMDIARDIVERTAPRAVAASKYLLAHSQGTDFRASRAYETEMFMRLAAEPDAAEGVAAFLEKRRPRWTGNVGADPV
ncbi:enoyl-CoA hydratase/isomerase family protein [Nocardia sp. BSTN01]|uniref:enoyl-CoA hydratase/isomerase family protein n=1 Tax=Nocardia sp. BSTN01 TaxID=2783665 RepID=UPI002814D8AC|nr:enoyl-CoA hydratase/isomerase family protein [Nocardia sp. BSTN01]